jgi:predicted nuclease of predicted toxin-antitoxin system
VAVKFLLDADLPRALFTALQREAPELDVLRVQQAGLRTAADPDILAFAAKEGRILVTKDKATMRDFAAERIARGEPMPGLLIIRPAYLRGLRGLGEIVRELIGTNRLSDAKDWEAVLRFIPPPH